MTFNKLLLVFLFLGGWASCLPQRQQEPHPPETPWVHVLADSLRLVPAKGVVFLIDKPFSGYGISYYVNGKKAVSTGYLNGKKNGLYQKWFESGQISFESQYVNGKQEGYTRTWWRNGKMRSEAYFKNGKPEGVQRQWYKSGVLFKRRQLVAGREHGLQQSWRENGKLYNNYEAKNGRIFGLKRATLCYQLDDESIAYEN